MRGWALLRDGPGLGLTRVPGFRAVHRLSASATKRLVRQARQEVVPLAVGDMTLFVDALDESMAARLRGEPYEIVESELFLREVDEGDVVFDVGANVGHYTLLAGRAVGPTGRVYAFEPNPAAYRLLVRSIEANGLHNVVPREAAVGERPGRTELWFDPHFTALASLDRTNARRTDSAVQVEIVSLDEFATSEGINKLDVLKIDAQGAEEMILAGAAGLLKAHRPVIFIELWPAGLDNLGSSVAAVLSRLAELDCSFTPVGAERPYAVDEMIALCEVELGADILARPT